MVVLGRLQGPLVTRARWSLVETPEKPLDVTPYTNVTKWGTHSAMVTCSPIVMGSIFSNVRSGKVLAFRGNWMVLGCVKESVGVGAMRGAPGILKGSQSLHDYEKPIKQLGHQPSNTLSRPSPRNPLKRFLKLYNIYKIS